MDNKFIEYIEKSINEKNLLKVENIEFSTSFNRLEFKLVYDDNKKEIFEQKKNEIESYIQNYVGEGVKIQISYKKSFLDCDYLKILIKKYLGEKEIFKLNNINEKNFFIEKKDATFFINLTIKANKELFDVFNNIFKSFIDNLKVEYFYDFQFNLDIEENEIEENDTEDFEDFDDTTYENYSFKNDEFVEVLDQTKYLGEIINSDFVNLTKINTPLDYVAICGKCQKFQKRFFKKKRVNKETNEEFFVDAERYVFKVQYKNSAISCSYFPKLSEQGKDLEIEDNTDICVDGKLEEYMGNLTLKIKNINFCKVIETEDTKIFLPIPKKYKKIFPEEIESPQIQVDFFTYLENKPVSSEIKEKNYIVFDLETTGLSSQDDSIIEVSAIKICGGNMIESFNTFVNPEKALPKEIIQITNITDDMVKDAPKGSEIIGDFMKFCDGCILVAYNAPFDMSFLTKLAYNNDYKVENEVVDAYALAKEKLQGLKKYKLKNVAEYLNVSLVGAHRAINDTLATAKVFLKLLEM